MFDFMKKNEVVKPLTAVTKDTVIGDILDYADSKGCTAQAERLFMSIGMHCLGCPASRGETVEEAGQVHGLSADELNELIAALNAIVQ